jgi:hypothetical protein
MNMDDQCFVPYDRDEEAHRTAEHPTHLRAGPVCR